MTQESWDACDKKLFMPKFIKSDISKCELVVCPTLVDEHWFCLVLEPKTMTMHILDSMTPSIAKKGQQKNVGADSRMEVAQRCLERFAVILQQINPDEFSEKPLGQVVREDVPQQTNLYDCGVYVLMWLNQWVPDAELKYTKDDVSKFRFDLMHWLITHPRNLAKERTLALLDGPTQSKRQRNAR